MRFLTQWLITSIAAMVVFDVDVDPRRLVAANGNAVSRAVDDASNPAASGPQIVRAKHVLDSAVFSAAGRRLGRIDESNKPSIRRRLK